MSKKYEIIDVNAEKKIDEISEKHDYSAIAEMKSEIKNANLVPAIGFDPLEMVKMHINDFYSKLPEFSKKAIELKNAEPSKETNKLAEENRLFIKKSRTSMEKDFDNARKPFQKLNQQFIDLKKEISDSAKSVEAEFKSIEDEYERVQEIATQKIIKERMEKIAPFCKKSDLKNYDFRNMGNDDFDAFFQLKKIEFEEIEKERIEKERIEKERIEKEAEERRVLNARVVKTAHLLLPDEEISDWNLSTMPEKMFPSFLEYLENRKLKYDQLHPEQIPAPTPEQIPAPTPEQIPAPTPEQIPAPTPEQTNSDFKILMGFIFEIGQTINENEKIRAVKSDQYKKVAIGIISAINRTIDSAKKHIDENLSEKL